MNKLRRYRFFLWFFGWFNVPMIAYLRPKLIELDDQRITVRIALKRRSKNHLHSMYFGALAVGADIAGGLHGFYHAEKAGCKISLVFKSFEAQFLKRPMKDVYFNSQSGHDIADMIALSEKNKERVNQIIPITAYTLVDGKQDTVAEFKLELSLKVVS